MEEKEASGPDEGKDKPQDEIREDGSAEKKNDKSKESCKDSKAGKSDKDGDKESKVADDDKEEEIFIPQAEYSAVCNADFLPMICNEFILEFLDKEHGACQLSKQEAIHLTRNFCHWIASNGLTCARIQLFNCM